MVPEQLIELRGMSIVTFMACGLFVFALGYIFSEFKNYRQCQKKFNAHIGKRVSETETSIAVMVRGDGSLEKMVDEVRDDINKLYGKMEDVRVELASMNGKYKQ